MGSHLHKPCSSGIGGGVGFFIRDSYKYRKVDTPNSLLESCNLTQSVNNTTHLHGHILDLILSPSDQDVLTSVNSYLIMQSSNVLLTVLLLLLTVKQ